ncbi:MAG TPA: hypothetical protein VK892_09620 [Pyrinomonadaceae bacterium]|nr:hypothetical protein [Pyrinomonadaceae bacterium]
MDNRKLARFCGLFCITGAIIAFIWGVLNTFYPNSAFLTTTQDFDVLNTLLYRIEHLSFAILVYPALFAGLLGFYFIGAIGRGIIGKILVGLAVIGFILSTLSSLVKVFLLQSEIANRMLEIGFNYILLLVCPILFTAMALFAGKVKPWKRFAPIITLGLLIVFTLPAFLIGIRYLPLTMGLALLSWSILGLADYTEKDAELLSE